LLLCKQRVETSMQLSIAFSQACEFVSAKMSSTAAGSPRDSRPCNSPEAVDISTATAAKAGTSESCVSIPGQGL
jgi:hypothetical protein